MIQITTTYHTLEMAGPRGIAWRPISSALDSEIFKMAIKLAEQGDFIASLNSAQDSYIEKYGEMHHVAFRIKTKTEIFTGLGNAEKTLFVPE
jgi:hypothetical protein